MSYNDDMLEDLEPGMDGLYFDKKPPEDDLLEDDEALGEIDEKEADVDEEDNEDDDKLY